MRGGLPHCAWSGVHREENGGGEFRLNLRYLRIPALMILAFSISAYAQSLGDVARQVRAERQQRGPSHLKVITNDDIESRAPAPAPRKEAAQDAAKDATQNEAGKEGEETAKSAGEAKGAKSKAGAGKTPATEHEEQELAIDKRTEQMDQVYLDRIANIRAQIGTAQKELTKLQLDQVESTNDFRRSVGTSPNVSTYQAEQHLFSDQIEAHRDLLNSLSSQLEDAQEAARHAGVAHASD